MSQYLEFYGNKTLVSKNRQRAFVRVGAFIRINMLLSTCTVFMYNLNEGSHCLFCATKALHNTVFLFPFLLAGRAVALSPASASLLAKC